MALVFIGMNKMFIDKVRKAVNTNKPIEAVKEVIAEYDEICRLAVWRERILVNGENIKTHQAELDKIVEILEKYGYYGNLLGIDHDKKIREYFKKI